MFLNSYVISQTNDFGIWTSVGAEKQLGKWYLGANTELRTFNNTSEVQRWSIQFDAEYKVIKSVNTGVSYKYMYFNDLKYTDYQPRIRYTFFIEAKYKVGDFKIFLREKLQRTIKDESDRLKENGKYDNYKINPEWTWRNRLKVNYNIPHFLGTPSFSIEPFFQLNNPEGNSFNNIRYTLSFDFKLSKQHEFKAYGLIDNEMNVDSPVRTFVLGFGYTFSF